MGLRITFIRHAFDTGLVALLMAEAIVELTRERAALEPRIPTIHRQERIIWSAPHDRSTVTHSHVIDGTAGSGLDRGLRGRLALWSAPYIGTGR